jgi:hypothetical protein
MGRYMTEILKEKGKCCISGKPLSTSEHITFVTLDYAPAWEFPYESNILFPDQPRRAVAAVHDDHIIPGKGYILAGLVKFAIEIRGEEIIYHPVSTLKNIRYVNEN